ncbi:MAG: TolC family protein [Planctomycetaceae bacterium]|nr:TolC family protein [Planctomycetaceae bacterium]
MAASYPKRIPFPCSVLRTLFTALTVFYSAAIADQTVGAEPGVEPPKDNAALAAALSTGSPRLLPPPADAGVAGPVQFAQPVTSATNLPARLADTLQMPEFSEEMPPGVVAGAVHPIDLPSALQLAGANNLQIALARERINQASARAAAANALWIPSISAGVVYNNHAGRLQETEGQILEVSRNSLFVGGGAVFGNSPANGGASGPARMFVDLSLADTIFEPLAARQLVRATAAERTATFNDTLLQVAATYFALVRAQSKMRIAEEAVQNAQELARITDEFAKSGHGLQADADRAIVEAASRRRDVLQAQEDVAVVSANLAQLLRLAPTVQLQAVDEAPVALEFVDQSLPLPTLIDRAVAVRPEISSADAQRDAAWYRCRQEQVRPWVPHLYAGVSGGGFGGGEGSDVDNFGGRADFDVAAIWEFENFGFGNAARQREQQSVHRQANLTRQEVRDLVAAEVTQAYRRVQLRQRQIEVARPQVESAYQAVRLNLEGIRGGVLRPIEIQQAIGALASSRIQHLDATIDYNVAQLQMLRAIGRPPDVDINAKLP